MPHNLDEERAKQLAQEAQEVAEMTSEEAFQKWIEWEFKKAQMMEPGGILNRLYQEARRAAQSN